MQDGGIDEGRELGLVPRDLLGLAADARPDRVYLLEPPGSHLLLGHDPLPASQAKLSTFALGERHKWSGGGRTARCVNACPGEQKSPPGGGPFCDVWPSR